MSSVSNLVCCLCDAPATIQCPRCIELSLSESPSSFFCSQHCLQSAWKKHKVSHEVKSLRNCHLIRNGRAAMQATKLLRRVYHEAPDDIFELIISKCPGSFAGSGSLNIFRLVNKRFKRAAELCTTKLSNLDINRPMFFPTKLFEICQRIEALVCMSQNLRSLEGCSLLPRLEYLRVEGSSVRSLEPLSHCHNMKCLLVDEGQWLSDLSPLASCSRMNRLSFGFCSIADISAVASMPCLELLVLERGDQHGALPVMDLSPLAFCTRLGHLDLSGTEVLDDISPLSACAALITLEINDCPFIANLSPLSTLHNLEWLDCRGIDPETSLLPLVSCTGLKKLKCDDDGVDLEELRRRRPNLKVLVEVTEDSEEEGW